MPVADTEEAHAHRAAQLLIERGLVGYVWLDEELVVKRRRGRLADWVPVGTAYGEALPMLVGYEETLRASRAAPFGSTLLANVGVPALSAAGIAKLDLRIFWMPAEREFLVALLHESDHGALQLELHQEIAQRQLAESREAQLSRSLKRANAELSLANRDLEAFAYVISHDLRAPLRALRITADLLEAELSGEIAASAQENLARIRLLSRRMGTMMSGLLEYARIGRKQDALADIDTADLIRDIVMGIAPPDGLTIERVGDWPQLTTLSEPLDVVLRNLIENAVKHHDTKRGKIRLSAHDDGDFVRFEVADDGPGIDASYHEAIFEPFRTVLGEATPESSGIGLALVKKTTELVGGRIEVVSEPGMRRGATFRVHWPKSIAIK